MHPFTRNGRRRDAEQVKREGWREQRLLAVCPEDPRLDPFERQFVINLGTRLYGAPLPEKDA